MEEWFRAVPLQGFGIRLELVEERHLEGLVASTDNETFRWFPSAPSSRSPEAMREHLASRLEPGHSVYAVCCDRSGEVLGSSAFYDVVPRHRALEIGYTWFAEEHRGTRANPATKLLMLSHALDACGAVRVQLKTDERNMASRAALAKLGATEEGRLRRHRLMPDGFWRTTVYFSILEEEWPEVRERLLARLE